MIPFKGILKYLIYIFIAGWMFFLGIMVGRGTAPVRFDTRKFQKRLETIASEFGKKKDVRKKIDLKFYDILDNPVQEESGTPEKQVQEIIPRKEAIVASGKILLKTSRKRLTFRKALAKSQGKKALEGKYTIQIAAYKNVKDAIARIAILEKKGFSSYRVKGEKDGETWYRVRTGSFKTYDEAKKIKEKLKNAKINSMIIKRDNNEDIKG
ncbi:MAG: SPOR domain-containing protein [Deltaproteobacteria bacterium]|nr:SPOR domain-containing protein [Deltaproteobacteria bacterium]